MRYAGKITEWNDERGFGFVVPNGGGDRAFIHISKVEDAKHRPKVGDLVTYAVTRDDRGRFQAEAVEFPLLHRHHEGQTALFSRTSAGLLALVLVAGAFVVGRVPAVVAGAYFAFSGLSFLAYWRDKNAAKRGAWRTRESTLHLLDVLGGWPGGLVAQQRFHHKTIKQPFQSIFWLSVIANIGGAWWLTASGSAQEVLLGLLG